MKVIRSHMWPLGGRSLDSKEAVILTAADKAASIADWISVVVGKDYKENLKENLIKDDEE